MKANSAPGLGFSSIRQIFFVISNCAKLLWKADKKSFLVTSILNGLESTFIIPNLYLDKLFIDTIINASKTGDPSSAFKTIVIIVILRFCLYFASQISYQISGYYDNQFYRRFQGSIERMVGIKYSQIDVSVIESPGFKDRYQKIDREGISRAYRIVDMFTQLPSYIGGLISSLAIIIFAFPLIVLLVIVFVIPVIIADRFNIKNRYDLDTELAPKQREMGWLGYYLVRSNGYLELRLLGIAKYLADKLFIAQEDVTKRWGEYSKRVGVRKISSAIPYDVFSYSLDIYFGYLAIISQITLGSAQAYIRAVSTFRSNLFGLVNTLMKFYENYLYVLDLMWFLNYKNEVENSVGVEFPKIDKGITFKDVWFRYPNSDKWILKGVSFQISKHENIALVGDNGAGKTTIVKLLANFYTPTKGEILIDGINLKDISRDSLWRNISIQFQDMETYSMSARESIGLGNLSYINELNEIRKYAKLSDIDDWIMSLPLGYSNPLSVSFEKGVSPSSGQAQRIGISRSLIKKSPLIVLDEPTSNVDPKAEEDIFNNILKLGKLTNIIFISHRFSTVRRADKIFVLKEGKISESGTHQELMKSKGEYYELFELQAKSYK